MPRRVRSPMDPTGELLSDSHWPVPDLYYYPPEKYVAINRERLIYYGAGEAGTLWGAVKLLTTPQQLVFGTTVGIHAERVYDCFTEEQLCTLWLNTMKTEYTGEDIRQDCLNLGRKIKAVATPIHLLAYDPENPPDYPVNTPFTTPNSTLKTPRNTPTHTRVLVPCEKPPQGTKTGLVWDTAEVIFAKFPNMNRRQLKAEVIDACVKLGINPSTAQVQFGKWGSQKALTN